MASATPVSRVRITTNQGLVQKLVTVLAENVIHLIGEHQTISEIVVMLLQTYGSGKRLRLVVKLRNGHEVRIQMTGFDYVSPDRLKFTGLIANGSDVVKIEGELTGTNNGGSFRIVD